MRLSRATLSAIPGAIRAPRHRAAPSIGVVHFGPGAFHRAHQASYIDDLLDHDPRWGIAGVSLRSSGTIEALAAQDGLYTVAVRDAQPALRIIGVSSSTDRLLSARFLKAGGNDFMLRPFIDEEFYCRVNQNLDTLVQIRNARTPAMAG